MSSTITCVVPAASVAMTMAAPVARAGQRQPGDERRPFGNSKVSDPMITKSPVIQSTLAQRAARLINGSEPGRVCSP